MLLVDEAVGIQDGVAASFLGQRARQARERPLCTSSIGEMLGQFFDHNVQRIAKPSVDLVEEVLAAVARAKESAHDGLLHRGSDARQHGILDNRADVRPPSCSREIFVHAVHAFEG